MKAIFSINQTKSGKVQVTGRGEYSAGGGVCHTFDSPTEARTVLRNLGYSAEIINEGLGALHNINPAELLHLPQIEVEQNLLNENGFKAIY